MQDNAINIPTVTLKTLERIEKFIQKEKTVTPTTISKKLRIHYRSVLIAINFLEEEKKIATVTDGNITLIISNMQ